MRPFHQVSKDPMCRISAEQDFAMGLIHYNFSKIGHKKVYRVTLYRDQYEDNEVRLNLLDDGAEQAMIAWNAGQLEDDVLSGPWRGLRSMGKTWRCYEEMCDSVFHGKTVAFVSQCEADQDRFIARFNKQFGMNLKSVTGRFLGPEVPLSMHQSPKEKSMHPTQAQLSATADFLRYGSAAPYLAPASGAAMNHAPSPVPVRTEAAQQIKPLTAGVYNHEFYANLAAQLKAQEKAATKEAARLDAEEDAKLFAEFDSGVARELLEAELDEMLAKAHAVQVAYAKVKALLVNNRPDDSPNSALLLHFDMCAAIAAQYGLKLVRVNTGAIIRK